MNHVPVLKMALDMPTGHKTSTQNSNSHATHQREYSTASCPSGRFPPSFIHQVIIITGLNKIDYVLNLK